MTKIQEHVRFIGIPWMRERNSRCIFGDQSTVRNQHFTIVELMVGMTILSILMLMMFQFVISAQRMLDVSDSTWGIYENSRIVFDLIERDLQSAVTSSIAGEEIPFYVGNPALIDDSEDPYDGNASGEDDARHICFVTSTEPHDVSTSKLCEVNYNHHVQEDAVDSSPYVLYRKLTSNKTTNTDGDVIDNPYWNFDGQPTDWYKNNPDDDMWVDYQKVVGGVAGFAITYYDSDGDQIIPDVDPEKNSITTLPTRVEVNLSLFDEDLTGAPQLLRAKTQKSYTKIFFLSHIED